MGAEQSADLPMLDTPRTGPRLVAEDAVNDLIRFSLVPAVLVPAIVPALESALMEMVPSLLGRATAGLSPQRSPIGGASQWRKAAPPSEAPLERAVLLARLSSLRDQITSLLDLMSGSSAPGVPAGPPTTPLIPNPKAPPPTKTGGGDEQAGEKGDEKGRKGKTDKPP